ncbi:MAG TPA: hypothetical protein ENJ90_07290 [Devosia sp.]|nr:hypothetical protein [Devosia sp.]
MNLQKTANLPTNWRIVLGFWALICVVYLARALFSGGTIPLISGSDDAMRLVVVSDWLSGQNWFDHTQYRLNTPFGANIHWSRLIDLPIAGLIVVLKPFVGANAPLLAAWVLPLLWLVALLYLSVGLSVRLAGPQAVLPGLVLPVLSAAVMVEFAPGRVDHHNVQIILTLALLYTSVMAWKNPRWALWAGLAAATSLAIAIEAVPQIATAIAVFGLFWVADPKKGATIRLFGFGFAGAAMVHLAIAFPPSQWFVPACDAFSIVYVAAALGVAAVFLILPFLALSSWWARLLAGGGLGLAMLGVLLVLFPLCRGGPYAAIDPWLAENWLSQIIEAKPAWNSFAALPAYTLGIALPPVIALILVGWIALKKPATPEIASMRAEWLILGAFLLVGIAVMLVQVRGARLVAGMIAPAGAFAIIFVRQRYLKSKSIIDALALLGTWLIFSGLAVAVIAGLVLPKGGDEIPATVSAGPSKFACMQPEAFEGLAMLDPQRIMAPVDLGAHLLLNTPHAVVGAPYHRNEQGLIDTFNFFNEPLAQSRSILKERGISLVVTCPVMAEMRGFSDAPETAFVNRVKNGTLPDWLKDISVTGSPLRIYEVTE